MGVDAFGKNPRSPAGRDFGLSTRAWNPLAAYCATLAPDICSDWSAASGSGLENDQAVAVAAILQTEIDAGHTNENARARDIAVKSLPKEDCNFCGTTGVMANGAKRFRCVVCGGAGCIYAGNEYDIFSTEIVAEFTRFLRDCGGFRLE